MKPTLLKAERKLREWSQAQVAEAVGVSVKTVSRWEQGLAIPHPYYRSKLLSLFDKTAEELGLVSDANENDELQDLPSPVVQSWSSDVLIQAAFLAAPTIPQDVEDTTSLQGHNSLINGQDERGSDQPEDDLFLRQNSWGHMGSALAFPHFNRFYSRWMPISSAISLFLVFMIAATLISFLHPLLQIYTKSSPQKSHSPANIAIKDAYDLTLYWLTIQNSDPSLLNVAQHFNEAFKAVYPQLVNRFALDPATAAKNIKLIFSSYLSSSASIENRTVTISSHWLKQHTDDVGLFTYELTLLLEHYPSSAPGWFASGVADYARSVYGPADDDDWSLPDGVQPQDSYLQGGGVAARFLLWLEQHTTLDIVDQLNHALQTQQSFSDAFQRLTHRTVNDLWRQYLANPDIALTPEQLYKTVTSRKPVYQGSLHVRIGEWHTLRPIFASKLYMSNFAIQSDMTIVSGNGQAGFIFRSGNVVNYCFRMDLHGTYGLLDQSHLLAAGFSEVIKQGLNQTNQVTVIAQKHTIYLYINGQFITKVDDSSLNYGAIAVMAIDQTKVMDVRFKNTKVF